MLKLAYIFSVLRFCRVVSKITLLWPSCFMKRWHYWYLTLIPSVCWGVESARPTWKRFPISLGWSQTCASQSQSFGKLGRIHFTNWTNTFGYLEKYNLHFFMIYLESNWQTWKRCPISGTEGSQFFGKLEKIHLTIWTNTWDAQYARLRAHNSDPLGNFL